MNKKKWKGLTVLSAVITLSLAGGILAGCGGNDDHSLSAVNEVAATCTEDGHKAYYKCTDDGCGKIFLDAEAKQEVSAEDVVLPALGHNPVHHDEKDATCTEDGNEEYWGCSRCDAKFADENQTPFNGDPVHKKTGHQDPMDHHEAKAPGAGIEGNVEYYYCNQCKKNFADSFGDKEIKDVVIPALKKLDSVTLTLKDVDGNAVPAGTQVSLTSKTEGITPLSATVGADGKIVLSGNTAVYGQAEYIVKLEGYAVSYPVTFTGATAEIASLEKVAWLLTDAEGSSSVRDGSGGWANHEDGKFENLSQGNKIAFNATFPISKELVLDTGEALKDADIYTLYFNLKMTNVTDKWTNRFGFRITDDAGTDTAGFFLIHKDNGELFVGKLYGKCDMNENFSALENELEKAPFKADAFAEGLNVKIVREQNAATLYAQIGGKWEEVSAVTLAGGKGSIGFSASAGNFEITDVGINATKPTAISSVALTLKDRNGGFIKKGAHVALTSWKGTIETTVGENGVVTLEAATAVYDNLNYKVEIEDVMKSYQIRFTGDTALIENIEVPVFFDTATLILKNADGTFVAEGTGVTLTSGSFHTVSATVGEDGVVTLTGGSAVYDLVTYSIAVEGYVFRYEMIFDDAEMTLDGLVNRYTSTDQVELDTSFEVDGGNKGSTTDGTDNAQIVLNANDWMTIDQALLKTTDTLKNAEVYTMTFNYKLSEIDEWGCARYGFRLTEGTKNEDAVGFFLFAQKNQVWLGNLRHDLEWRYAMEWNGNKLPDHFKEVSDVLTADMLLTGVDLKIEYRFGEATIYVENDGDWTKVHSVNVTGTPQIAFALGHHTITVKELAVDVIKVEKIDSVALTLKDSNGDFLPAGTKITLTSTKGNAAGSVGANGVVMLTGENAVWSYADYTVSVENSTTTDLMVWFNGATAELGGFVMPSPFASVALTLKAGDTPVAQGTKVTLTSVKGKIETTVGTNGVVTLAAENAVYDLITYTVKVDGYAFSSKIVFDGATAEINSFDETETVDWQYSNPADLEVVAGSGDWANGNLTNNSTDDKIAFNAAFSVSKEVVVDTGDAFGTADCYTLYFNLKMTGTNGWENRFGIRVTEGTGESTVGFYFFQKDDGAIEVGALRGKIDFNANGGEAKSTLNANMFVNGLKMKVVREHDTAKLYAKTDGTWGKPIFTVTLGGYDGALGFSASQGTFEYTDVSLDVKPLVKKTLTLTLNDGNGAFAENTDVKLTNYRGETQTVKTAATGKVTLENAYLGTYFVEVDGIPFNVTFSEDSLTASKTISPAWTYTGKEGEVTEHRVANADNITITHDSTSVTVAAEGFTGSDEWKRDGAYINVPDTALNDCTNYVVRFKLTATLMGGWTERFGIRLISGSGDNDNVGFLIWSKGDNLSFTTLDGNVNVGGREPKDNTIITNAAVKDGLDIQIVRNGNSATMYAKIDGTWKEVYTVTLSEGQTPQLGFYAVGGTYTYSDMSIVTVSDTVSE